MSLLFKLAINNIPVLKKEAPSLIGQNLGINQNMLKTLKNDKKGSESEIWTAKYYALAQQYAQNDQEHELL